jgi:MATE family multidrug resistance protein
MNGSDNENDNNSSSLPLLSPADEDVSKSSTDEDFSTRGIRKKIISAAWPQATVVCARTCIDMTNVVVLGHLGTDELAGSAFATIVTSMSSVILWQGFGDALITLTSQAIGARNPKLAGVWLQTSVLAISLMSIPVGIIWWYTEDLLHLIGDSGPSEEVIHYSGMFARWSLLWLMPDAAFGAFSQWLNGMQKVKPTIPITIIFVFYNLAANYFFVHGGLFGFEGYGFIGCPIATATTKILRGITLVWYMCYKKRYHEEYWTPWSWSSFGWSRMSRFMAQALPAATVGLVEQAQFVFITLLVGTIGSSELAAHSGMLNVFNLVSCAMYGLTDGGASTVGYLLGKGRPVEAKRASGVLLSCMGVMGVVVAGLFVAFHSQTGKIFSKDSDVVGYASDLSIILSICYVLLAATFACFGTLQGQGRPHIAAISMFFGLWGLSVPLAWLFGLHEDHGLVGIWWGLCIGYACMTTVMVGFVLRSDWATLAVAAQKRSEAKVEKSDVDAASSGEV